MASGPPAAVVLGPLHVSCFVTAANRATPVFDVQPDRKCVRVVTKATPHAIHCDTSLGASGVTPTTPTATGSSLPMAETPSVEWDFHAVFAAATHSTTFFRDVTQPALRSVVVDGVNSNVVATGIHPTQKFRFLFGKSASTAAALSAPAPPRNLEEKDVLDLHGQLGGLLFVFFYRIVNQPEQLQDWAVGISSWILVNNQAVDLLQTEKGGGSNGSSLSFTSIEAVSFASALQTLQTAKTHRIVRKHTAEHSHFFVRLAFFHRPTGQLSTLHVVDLMDLKDFGDDTVSKQEKLEFYDILHEIRQQTHAMAARTPSVHSPKPKPSTSGKKAMLLSNFLQPLLTQNAQTFLYVNVIDSRASLRESVALLNAVANVKGFACVCRRLTGITFEQLGFQPPAPPAPVESVESAPLDSAAAKAMAAVAIGESLLHRLSSGTASASPMEKLSASPVVNSDALSWLEAFKQRKQEILASTMAAPIAPMPTTHPPASVDELPLGLTDFNSSWMPAPASSSRSSTVAPAAGTSSDLYTRLMETIEQATPSPGAMTTPTIASLRTQLRRSSSMPLPIEDDLADNMSPHPPPRPHPSISQTLASRLAETIGGGAGPRSQMPSVQPPLATRPTTLLPSMELPCQVMTPPNVTGLDAATAAKIQATDAALLRKNYDALLSVVREQQQLREAAETRASEIVHDYEERRAQYEVHIENLKLEAVALKSKVRQLEKQSGVGHVFDQYEHELESLQRELQQLRMQNVELELRLASPTSGEAVASFTSGSMTELKKRYQAMAHDKLELERQLHELRKKERQFHAQSKLIYESTRKVDRLSRELAARDGALLSTRLNKQRLSAEVSRAHHETEQLQQENERLLVEKAATTEELLASKMYLASVESEQKRAEILDKFVRKHGDRMQRLRGRESSNNVEPETWRRDAAARETEDRLFQGVKRSVPQLVPLATKVLRKLETQELSLREFAEREVDLIQLLVELASDQPARALKTMIHDELQKLSLG